MRTYLRSTVLFVSVFIAFSEARKAYGQFFSGLGSKQQSNDQKAGKLLHDKLPLVLDANSAYPTVPDQDLLGGPFHPRTLPITLGTLTKPLPPGDYVLPMTFFCSEYSVHRGGNGIAYQLGPAQGTAAKAISTLLWRGMLTGHKPQELQSVSWAIQGSVAYDKMPPKYRALVDQLIPEMKNQVNGQAFADIEDGFQGKVNRATKKISEAIGKGTGGFVHADIKVDVELNGSFERLGQVGRSALDGEKLNTIFTAAFPSDQAREQALYAGQGQQTAALPASNGPWSVKVPGVAYMRFVVHGGNLQGDNAMQIRILPPRTSQALVDKRPHLVFAEYEQAPQSTPPSPSVISLFNGSVNEAALSQCQETPVNQQACMAQAITVSGNTGYSIGTGAQAPIMAPGSPLPVSPIPPPSQIADSTPSGLKVLPIIYGPAYDPNGGPDHKGSVGICIFLGARKIQKQQEGANYNWVQEIKTLPRNGCPVAGNPDLDIDSDCKESANDFANSDLYRGKNHSAWESPTISTWIDPEDNLSFDYLFSDMPNRTLLPLPVNKSPQWTFTANLYPVRVDSEGISGCPLSSRELGMQNGNNPPYCRQLTITYGIIATRQSGINGEIKLQLDPLIIDGKQVAPSRNYSLSLAGKIVPNDEGKLPMTSTPSGVTERVCRPTIAPVDSLHRRLPGEEPTRYKGPFIP